MEENRNQSNEQAKQTVEAPATRDLETRIWDALRECYDPEIPVNIVDLGLVYGVKIEDEIPGEANVYVSMTLTAPGCGLAPMIAADVKRRVQQVPGVRNVMVELTFDPPWNPSMMTEAAKLQLNMV
ncbi:MAG: iron-sulfur cluster assembly protein [Ignavibacteriae bacterium]|nr:iron-sulfur cluster assembly protein [Ignavibacteriota bacterium]